jgi:hypothetical protein
LNLLFKHTRETVLGLRRRKRGAERIHNVPEICMLGRHAPPSNKPGATSLPFNMTGFRAEVVSTVKINSSSG